MRELTTLEMEQVGGGWAFLGPVVASLSPTVVRVGVGALAGGAAFVGSSLYSLVDWSTRLMENTCEQGGRASVSVGFFSASCDRTQAPPKTETNPPAPTDGGP